MLGASTYQSVGSTQSSNGFQSKSVSDKFYLTGEQYSKFLRPINEKQGVVEVTSNMVGIFYNFFKTNNYWVVDSGDDQHMTRNELILEILWMFMNLI